jgi:predicted ATPase/class 3 adenylate cyclase
VSFVGGWGVTGRQSGTWTFLLTDIEDSTRRWQADREAMAAALEVHDATLTRVIDANGGRVFKHTGDGVCAVFGSVGDAVAAASAAQDALELPVRMGVHTGDAEARNGDFYGMTLNRCARIMDAGHGGQVLLSSIAAALHGGDVMDLGEHLLKGVTEPERIWQLGPTTFPALRVVARKSAVPAALTSLVGRDELVEQVVERLGTARLVTLVGVGGVGKTRVAMAAAELVEPDRDLTVFVPLNEVSDDQEVLPALARALGLTTPTLDAVAIALSGRRALVLIDNCEHVIDGSADLVEQLLGASPTVTVLATSREGLAVAGEQLVGIPGLDGSGGDAMAVALFVDRARNADSAFQLGGDDVAVVAEICRRLDGLPLAIELAAARVNVLPAAELLKRLDERFDVLTGSRRRRSRDRQRTLRETVDWSYELLDDDERLAFERLSVFAGSFGLDGAEAILDGVSGADVLDLVEALVSKSLLAPVDIDGFHRYRYLETIRSYAEERLETRGSTAEAADRLHDHLVAVIGVAVDQVLFGPLSGADRLRVEIPNLRRAFDHAIASSDVERAASLIVPFAALRSSIDWRIHGWADEVLALSGAAGSPHEADLLALRSVDAWLDNRFGELRSIADDMMHAAEQSAGLSFSILHNAMAVSQLLGDDERTRSLADESGSDFARTAWFRHMAALLPSNPDAPTVELDDLRDDVALLSASESELDRGNAAFLSAMWAYSRGDFEEMRIQSEAARELAVVGAGNWFAALQVRAWAQYELGEYCETIRTADEDIEQAYRHGDRSAMIVPLALYAMVLKACGEVDAVAIIRGRLPRRLTVLMIRELAEIDRWLAAELPPERRRELASVGAEKTPRELQALVHEAAARHLDLTG